MMVASHQQATTVHDPKGCLDMKMGATRCMSPETGPYIFYIYTCLCVCIFVFTCVYLLVYISMTLILRIVCLCS